ncbi:MAG: DUF4339 domain-containing protein [Bacteriovoracaceae bacterium]|nr:DUF4339 domain-containing protein [Bacteriovoracaceae bacterium]
MKWFILLPTGHEGPYSLSKLAQLIDQKKIAADVKVWAEGLAEPVVLKKALAASEVAPEVEIPDLPPIPEPLPEQVTSNKLEDDLPPLPVMEETSEIEVPVTEPEKKNIKLRVWSFIFISVVLMLFFAFGNVLKSLETFNIGRLPKMTLELHERILKENSFGGWDKKIFFKEYLPDDHSHIWLVTTSFQTCKVEASFQSIKDKMLSLDNETVAFKTKGELKNHVVEFSSFEFTAGNKIIPGLYEMDVKATHCKWEGLSPLVLNKFQGPESEYIARTKVVLFSKGAIEFNKVLDKLLQKKMAQELKEKTKEDLFWQNLQQKFETLQAITLQIEQLMLDFLEQKPNQFQSNLKPMVDQYTRKFGSFLTSFIIDNEKYFKDLKEGASKKRNYELMVKLTTKRIGLETMKFIEEFQNLKKNPTVKEVNAYSERVKKVFAAVKNDIAQKIIQVSEDRSK